jgi:hypothetical protein
MDTDKQENFIAELAQIAANLSGPLTTAQQAAAARVVADMQKNLGTYENCEPSKVQRGAIDFIFRRSDGAITRVPVAEDETDEFMRLLMTLKTMTWVTMNGMTPAGAS